MFARRHELTNAFGGAMARTHWARGGSARLARNVPAGLVDQRTRDARGGPRAEGLSLHGHRKRQPLGARDRDEERCRWGERARPASEPEPEHMDWIANRRRLRRIE